MGYIGIKDKVEQHREKEIKDTKCVYKFISIYYRPRELIWDPLTYSRELSFTPSERKFKLSDNFNDSVVFSNPWDAKWLFSWQWHFTYSQLLSWWNQVN